MKIGSTGDNLPSCREARTCTTRSPALNHGMHVATLWPNKRHPNYACMLGMASWKQDNEVFACVAMHRYHTTAHKQRNRWGRQKQDGLAQASTYVDWSSPLESSSSPTTSSISAIAAASLLFRRDSKLSGPGTSKLLLRRRSSACKRNQRKTQHAQPRCLERGSGRNDHSLPSLPSFIHQCQ